MSNANFPNLNGLIGSRICHDLINPLGAIGNGLELLGLAGYDSSPELDLVTDSVSGATARLKFLRLAFGAASTDQTCRRSEILATLDAAARGGRISYSWNVAGDPPRLDVRTALLAMMCVETALPVGGDINIEMESGNWTIHAKHNRLTLDPALWVPLSKNTCPENLTAALVHFGLLAQMAGEAGRILALSHGVDWVKISF